MLASAPILLQSTPVWIEVEIETIRRLTPTIKAFRFQVPWGATFRAGQCVDFRLTAEDGYQAQRYYSIATAPSESNVIEVMVERQNGGEVSSFFHDTLMPGDKVEVRGPIGGGPFTWQPPDEGPILLIGGGSGVAPLLSMVRHRRDCGSKTPFTLLYSTKKLFDVLSNDELFYIAHNDSSFQLIITLTREHEVPRGYRTGRVNQSLLDDALSGIWASPNTTFICGSNGFVGDVSDLLLKKGLEMYRVRTERFGG